MKVVFQVLFPLPIQLHGSDNSSDLVYRFMLFITVILIEVHRNEIIAKPLLIGLLVQSTN